MVDLGPPLHLSTTHTQHDRVRHTPYRCEARETNSHLIMGEGCRLEDIYIYIYIYIYPPIYTPLPTLGGSTIRLQGTSEGHKVVHTCGGRG